jgi:ACT domain-containing protein
MSRTAQQKKLVLEALERSLGVVTTACKQVSISRTTYYKWLQNDKMFAQKVEAIEAIALDFAESQLHKQIQKGSTAATIFYLKTKGKKRGYIENPNIALVNDNEITVTIQKASESNSGSEPDDK